MSSNKNKDKHLEEFIPQKALSRKTEECIDDRPETLEQLLSGSMDHPEPTFKEAFVIDQPASNLPEFEPLDTKDVVGDLKWVMDDVLTKHSVLRLIKGLFVVWLIQKLAMQRRNVPFCVQKIDEFERVNREETRQGFLRWVMPVFVIWVIVGLVVFVLTGNFWLLLATPALGIILRKATKHYFSLPRGLEAASLPTSVKSPWWRKLFMF